VEIAEIGKTIEADQTSENFASIANTVDTLFKTVASELQTNSQQEAEEDTKTQANKMATLKTTSEAETSLEEEEATEATAVEEKTEDRGEATEEISEVETVGITATAAMTTSTTSRKRSNTFKEMNKGPRPTTL
jgi:hypothetical protein